MHPIERLRYVARATHVPGGVLARETAMALADFVGDDAGMLIACRRILDRQPASGPLVWLCAHALGAPDQRRALWEAVDGLEADQTEAALAFTLPDDPVVATVGWTDPMASLARKRGDASFVVVDPDGNAEYQLDRVIENGHNVTIVGPEATAQAMFDATHLIVDIHALGPDAGLAPMGSFAAAAVARHLETPVWGVASLGVALGDKMYQGLTKRWNAATSEPRYLRHLEEVPTSLLDQVVTTAGAVSCAQAISNGGCPIVPELY